MPSQIVKATCQAGALSALSNVMAQCITCHRAGTSYSLDFTQLIQFVAYAVLSCPPNCVWQEWLEASFPGYSNEHLTSSEKEKLVDDAISGDSTGVQSTQSNGDLTHRTLGEKALTKESRPTTTQQRASKLSIKNTAIKFTLDQTIGAAVNTVMFIAGIALLRGQSLDSMLADVQQKFWPMTFTGQKLWPAVSILSFAVIPLEQRMLFGAVAGLFWGIYLSLVSGSGK